MAKRGKASGNGNGANLGFEAKLWQAADKRRYNMDAAEYKHVVLGLIFLKYVLDAFERQIPTYFSSIFAIMRQSVTLCEARYLLLPKLLASDSLPDADI